MIRHKVTDNNYKSNCDKLNVIKRIYIRIVCNSLSWSIKQMVEFSSQNFHLKWSSNELVLVWTLQPLIRILIEKQRFLWFPLKWEPLFVSEWCKTVQCVPIKRKPVLSVRYLHCQASFNQTICFIIKGIFCSLHLIPNTWWYLNAWLKRNNLNSCVSKSICAEQWCWVDITKFRLANPCQNKESNKAEETWQKRQKKG